MCGIAQKLGRFGNKQAVDHGFPLQNAIQMQVIGGHGSDNRPFQADNQFFTGYVALNAPVHMNNAFADDVSGNFGVFADNWRNRYGFRIFVKFAGKFQKQHFF